MFTASAAIIQHIMKLRDAGEATLAYFYFDFRDKEKQNVRNAVTSLIIQLSAYSKPCCDIVYHLYLTHGKGLQQPGNDILIARLKEMLTVTTHHPIFIIMDALDECPNIEMPTPREAILILVKDLVRLQLPNLHICATSRPEIDIRSMLMPLASNTISLHDETGHSLLIANYVSFLVSTDETYERALEDINKKNQEHARRLLHCLAVAVRPLRVEELAEILAFDFDVAQGGVPRFHPNWRPKDQEEAVLSICSSLVTIVDNQGSRVVQFSHPSVREFLTSYRFRTSTGNVSRYHILPGPAHTIFAQACLGILLHMDDRDLSVKDYPLVEYAARHWIAHASPCCTDCCNACQNQLQKGRKGR